MSEGVFGRDSEATTPGSRLMGLIRRAYEQAVAQLKAYYDGYHFSKESPDIYNPFSLLTAFAKGGLESSWFGSGTPAFLLDLLARHDWDIAHLDGTVASGFEFDAAVEQMATPLPMLYQSGYLTIKDYDAPNDSYILGIPNREVSQGLSECLDKAGVNYASSERTVNE